MTFLEFVILFLVVVVCIGKLGAQPQPQHAVFFMPVGWQGTVCIVAEPQTDSWPQKHCLKQFIQKQKNGTLRIEAVTPSDAKGFSVYTTSRYGNKFSSTSKDGQVVTSGVDVR